MECLELWSVRLHIICHTSRKTNHLCSTTLFSQDAECNADSQSRHTRENRSDSLSQQILLFRHLFLSLSRSALSVSRALSSLTLSHALFLCLSLLLSHSPSVQLNLSPLSLSFSPSSLLSFSLFPFIFLSFSYQRRSSQMAPCTHILVAVTSTAELDLQNEPTKNQFANEPEGLR